MRTNIIEAPLITDEYIIKILKNAWDNMPGPHIADAFLTTNEMAQVLRRSRAQTLKRLKNMIGKTDKIKGVKHPGAWLWRYNGEKYRETS